MKRVDLTKNLTSIHYENLEKLGKILDCIENTKGR
jgi:hypothetical protein